MAQAFPKLAELDGFGTQIRAALAKVEEVATQADARVSVEIGHVTGIIDTAIGKIKTQVDELASATAAACVVPQASAAEAPPPATGPVAPCRADR